MLCFSFLLLSTSSKMQQKCRKSSQEETRTAAQFPHPKAASLSQLTQALNCSKLLSTCMYPSIHVTFANIFCGTHLHNIPPDLKIAEDMIDFWVASLTQPKPLLLRGSECVTQDYTIHCESESGRLCFGMYGGGKGCEMCCVICPQSFHFHFPASEKGKHTRVCLVARAMWDEGILQRLVLFFVISANLSVLSIAVFSPLKAIDLFVCLQSSV